MKCGVLTRKHIQRNMLKSIHSLSAWISFLNVCGGEWMDGWMVKGDR